jgi:hypothetical protein
MTGITTNIRSSFYGMLSIPENDGFNINSRN